MEDEFLEHFADRAKQIYDEQYRAELERSHRDMFCAIEPDSGDYFWGKTMSDASRASRRVYPDRMTHTIRVGHPAAIHPGRCFK